MGNSNNSDINLDHYEHPRLGNVKKLQQHQKNQYILYEMILQNKKIYEDWIKQVTFIKAQEAASQILFLPVQQQFQHTAYCGTGGILKLKYQDYFYSILPEIQNRKNIKRPFNQQELLYLFYSLIKISAILQTKNRTIGDIKPENILVNQDGYVKIISHISWPSQPMKISQNYQKANQRLLLSPQQFEQRSKKKEMSSDTYQSRYSEIYSIGLTILEAGTLKSCSEIYGGHNECKFNEMKLLQLLQIFQGRYSKEFGEIIKQMLHPVPKKRWRTAYIYEILRPYEYQIMNLQEILIKLDKNTSIPRIERQEKISIKKIGQSYYSQSDHLQKNQKHKISHEQEIRSIGQKKQKQNMMMHSQQNLWSPTHYNNSMLMNSSNRFNFPPQNSKYHLVNQHTNFGRPITIQSPQQIQFMSNWKNNYHLNNKMAISMPIDLSGYQQLHKSGSNYITQNSMMAGLSRGLSESNYMGEGYYLRE